VPERSLARLTFTTMPQTVTEKETDVRSERERAPLFNVVLLNDDDHSYDYVIEMLQKIFCVSSQQAFAHAVEVDSTGRTILITCGLEEAQFARDQIHAYGADPRIPHCRGSMSAVIEPAHPATS